MALKNEKESSHRRKIHSNENTLSGPEIRPDTALGPARSQPKCGRTVGLQAPIVANQPSLNPRANRYISGERSREASGLRELTCTKAFFRLAWND